MEELLKLADDVYKQYESMESLASQHFEVFFNLDSRLLYEVMSVF